MHNKNKLAKCIYIQQHFQITFFWNVSLCKSTKGVGFREKLATATAFLQSEYRTGPGV